MGGRLYTLMRREISLDINGELKLIFLNEITLPYRRKLKDQLQRTPEVHLKKSVSHVEDQGKYDVQHIENGRYKDNGD